MVESSHMSYEQHIKTSQLRKMKDDVMAKRRQEHKSMRTKRTGGKKATRDIDSTVKH